MTTPRPAYAAPLPAVDEVEAVRAGDTVRILARKTITATDPYLSGHFPGQVIFPGVFIIEALRQAVATALDPAGGPGPDILALRSVRFLVPLRPGDVLTIDAVVTSRDGRLTADARGRRADGVTAARLRVEFDGGGWRAA